MLNHSNTNRRSIASFRLKSIPALLPIDFISKGPEGGKFAGATLALREQHDDAVSSDDELLSRDRENGA